MKNRSTPSGILRRTIVRTVLLMAVLGLVVWFGRQRPAVKLPPAPPAAHPAEQAATDKEAVGGDSRATPGTATEEGQSHVTSQIDEQVIRDQDGKVAFRGEVDLSGTLNRIQTGKKLRFPNDGSVFQNRERRLPRQPAGYYHEWVHPTPGLDGPGPQRIVTGEQGEIYYTPDHYRTFRRLDGREESGVGGQAAGDRKQ